MTTQPTLDPAYLRRAVRRFLAEDVGRGDVTTMLVVPPDASGRARIEARSDLVVCGGEAVVACFEAVADDVECRVIFPDGAPAAAGDAVASVKGSLRALLVAERTALNLLGRMSGIAGLARRYAAAVEGLPVKVVDTRKTTPGLRVLEKYAVRVGGCHNHRFGLDDGILIKDNHIAAAGGIEAAIERARLHAPHGMKIEVEVTDLEELQVAMGAGADVVMLDNMSVDDVREAVSVAGGKALLEVSGGVTLDNVRSYAETGVDLVSVGALTHSAPHADVAMEVVR